MMRSSVMVMGTVRLRALVPATHDITDRWPVASRCPMLLFVGRGTNIAASP
jgi:hypothetical protein